MVRQLAGGSTECIDEEQRVGSGYNGDEPCKDGGDPCRDGGDPCKGGDEPCKVTGPSRGNGLCGGDTSDDDDDDEYCCPAWFHVRAASLTQLPHPPLPPPHRRLCRVSPALLQEPPSPG